jgi:hypothetical protein
MSPRGLKTVLKELREERTEITCRPVGPIKYSEKAPITDRRHACIFEWPFSHRGRGI